MKNFSINIGDKEYWISRSVAVAAFLFKVDEDGDICVLANKRGPGTPDFQGFWNCPCGYLDYNETLIEAVHREVLEETGIVCPNSMKMVDIDSNPNSNRQNVTVYFYGFVENPTIRERIGGEKDEVDDIQWIKVKNLDSYQWAFNHNKIIHNISQIII